MPPLFPNSINAPGNPPPQNQGAQLTVLLYLHKTQLNPLRQLTVSAPQQETTILPEIV